jgi:cell shape-determining protein MreC
MKMIYPQRDNRRKQKRFAKTAGVIGGVLVIVIILNFFNPNFFAPLLQTIGKPIFEARGGVLGSVNTFFEFLHSKAAMVAENNVLKERLALTDAIKLERDYYKSYNAELLKRTSKTDEKQQFTLARIISKPGVSPYDTIVIDVGVENSISVHDLVFAEENVILGEVLEVYKNSALVGLYSSPGKETNVLIGPKAIPAIATGKGGGNFEVKFPRNTEILVHDTVVMASSSINLLGKVESIQSGLTDTFERALFKNVADVTTLNIITVVKKSK